MQPSGLHTLLVVDSRLTADSWLLKWSSSRLGLLLLRLELSAHLTGRADNYNCTHQGDFIYDYFLPCSPHFYFCISFTNIVIYYAQKHAVLDSTAFWMLSVGSSNWASFLHRSINKVLDNRIHIKSNLVVSGELQSAIPTHCRRNSL